MSPDLSPTTPFDIRYFCEVLSAMYANRAALELIVEGKAKELGFGDD